MALAGVDGDSVSGLLSLGEEEAERVCFEKMQQIDASWRVSFGEAGLICRLVHQNMLWRYRQDPETGMPCGTFEEWVRISAPWSRAKVYEAKKMVDALWGDVPEEKLRIMPRSTMIELVRFSSEVRQDPRVVDAAISMSPQKFVEVVRDAYPEQHAESITVFRVTLSREGKKIVDEALEKMMSEEMASNRGEALERMAVLAIESLGKGV